jgi:hypothetical protein
MLEAVRTSNILRFLIIYDNLGLIIYDNLGCGVAQIVARRLALRQARVRNSAPHP